MSGVRWVRPHVDKILKNRHTHAVIYTDTTLYQQSPRIPIDHKRGASMLGI
jgi:hypothetical protein